MRWLFCIATIVLALLTAFAQTGMQTASIVAIKSHPQGRIAHWEGRTPIYDGNPIYDITLQLNNKNYVVRYESLTGYYPRAWSVGSKISVKRERGQFILYRGEEAVPAREVSTYDCVQANSPATASITPQVPCD